MATVYGIISMFPVLWHRIISMFPVTMKVSSYLINAQHYFYVYFSEKADRNLPKPYEKKWQ